MPVRTWAIIVAALVVAGVAAASPEPGERDIGGALCRPVIDGGVICRWPGHPWAVSVSADRVIAWRNVTRRYVHANRLTAPLSAKYLRSGGERIGGALCKHEERLNATVCWWPTQATHPWAVGINRRNVYVWQRASLHYVEANR